MPASVSLKDNNFLTRLSSNEEIKNSVFVMDGEGAPGPDGFGGCFY